jgi:polyisoprenyl-phosphate glycosyltransferase
VSKPLVTVVCPVFNEEATVERFFARLVEATRSAEHQVDFEFLLIDNRSTDRTPAVLAELQAKEPRARVVTFSRNYGYQASITAGMRLAAGDAIVNIDTDGEDPPELIPLFIERWLSGVDVVYGLRHEREEFVLLHLARKLFYRVIRRVADHEIVLDMAEFFLVDKRVRDASLATKSTFPFVRGQVGYVGFRREGIPYKRRRRMGGASHYNLLAAARFGMGGVLSSSTLPLRWLAYVGVSAFLVDLAIAIALVAGGGGWGLGVLERLLGALVTLHLGWGALAVGVVGLYVARIYKDTVGLPLYVVDEQRSARLAATQHARTDPAA